MYTPETSNRILQFRQKAANNTLTKDDMREAITILRQGRTGAHAVSAVSKAKAKAVNTDDLLSQLDGL